MEGVTFNFEGFNPSDNGADKTMQVWRCERCGYTHIGEAERQIPSRCPSCRSTRITRAPVKSGGEDNQDTVSQKIYRVLDRIPDMPVNEQEESRRKLKESAGVHILCLDERKGRLREVLTRNEVQGYLSLIRNQNFGLAVIGRSVVAVSPDSPIRPHVGINQSKLDELEDLSKP